MQTYFIDSDFGFFFHFCSPYLGCGGDGGGNRTEAVLVGVEAHEEGGRRTTAVFQRSNYLSIYLLDL